MTLGPADRIAETLRRTKIGRAYNRARSEPPSASRTEISSSTHAMSGFCGTAGVLAVVLERWRHEMPSCNWTSVGSSKPKRSRLLFFGRRGLRLCRGGREPIGHPDQLGQRLSTHL